MSISLISLLCLNLSWQSAPTAPLPPPPAADWLVDPAPYKAVIREDQARGELILDNGLVRRVLRKSPNLATTSYRLLPQGEELLRATGPEAVLSFDGVDYAIGGLGGQPVANYLKDAWLKDLKADPQAYAFADWTQGPLEARFAWKKRPEWLSRDLPWPAPGRHLALRFVPPAAPPPNSGAVLFAEEFRGALKEQWKIHVSPSHARSSFSNEGKAGEIYTPAESAVYAEAPWPAEARSLEVALDCGDDATSNAWGPGLALMAEGKVLLHFIVRPNQQVFEINGELVGKFDRSQPQRLRVRYVDERLLCEAAEAEGPFQVLARLPAPKLPSSLRVGKTGRGGAGQDFAEIRPELVRCHIKAVELRAAAPAGEAKPRADLPEVTVHYNLYDGLPLIEKWLTVKNGSGKAVRLDRTLVERLHCVEEESAVEPPGDWISSRLFVETDFTYCSMGSRGANRFSVKWKPDRSYKTQVNYDLETPCLLEVAPESGPAVDLKPGEEFTSIRCFEMLKDSTERERASLAQRRFYRTAAPWTQENPVMVHLISSDPKAIRAMIDQAGEVGVEMIILSFGSGMNMESRDPAYAARYKELSDYAASKGIVLGSYSLLASRGGGKAEDNCGGPGSRVRFGVAPCLGSKWGQDYLRQIADFMKATGFAVFENDGSYAADTCAHKHHPGHRDLADSQWRQWQGITALYKDCRAKGIYLNVPDWYFLNGSSKTGMGYRETNWSLPRAEQEIIERQNIFDGTWEKTPSMGWMFVPLTQYHGGGAAATIEPLKDHLPHYETRLANLFGAGVQACYRGPRIYDSDETKALVKKWIGFYKKHRQVLDSDLIHLRRPDGRDWDGILHVNPQGAEKAMAFLYNPLEVDIERDITLPLHYAGLSGRSQIRIDGGTPQESSLSSDQLLRLKIKIPARGRTWVLIE
ncbi:MAG: hypothetical protein RL095_2841 [Verrucomicrobiota bacterium]|jgi:hypothetical protein